MYELDGLFLPVAWEVRVLRTDLSADRALAFQALAKKSFYPSRTRTKAPCAPGHNSQPDGRLGAGGGKPQPHGQATTRRAESGTAPCPPAPAQQQEMFPGQARRRAGPRSSAGPHQAAAPAQLGQDRRQGEKRGRRNPPGPSTAERGNPPPAAVAATDPTEGRPRPPHPHPGIPPRCARRCHGRSTEPHTHRGPAPSALIGGGAPPLSSYWAGQQVLLTALPALAVLHRGNARPAGRHVTGEGRGCGLPAARGGAWERRVAIYDALLRSCFNCPGPSSYMRAAKHRSALSAFRRNQPVGILSFFLDKKKKP